jgi:hypothetical protein
MLEFLKLFGYRVVHFIHIGKTAGTAIKEGIKQNKFIWSNISIIGKYIFQMENHVFTMRHLKEDEYVFFIIRDPISRFVSGFYSRLRMGQPKLYNPWSEGEKIAFSKFATPNDLGESLSAEDPILKEEAERAMKSIGHVNSSYWHWFIDEDYILKRRKSLLFYVRQEKLDSDLNDIGKRLGFSFPALPKDEVKSHKNPEHFDKKLSETAIANLKVWYSRDYDFIDFVNGMSENGIPK